MTRSRRACRRPTLADILILIAAMGVGFGITRPWVAALPSPPSGGLAKSVAESLIFSFPCGGSATVAWMVVRWRRPRPDRPRLMRQPGLFACCGVLLTAAMAVLAVALSLLTSSGRDLLRQGSHGVENIIFLFVFTGGYGVLFAWGLLRLSGRWRREPGWIDATGILLGIYWVILSLTSVTVFSPF